MAGVFSLEAVNARHGDALLLHYGDPAQGLRTLLLDGGPTGVYGATLKPRLEQIAQQRGRPFALAHAFVTHLDNDHIAGVLDFAEDADPPARCRSFWFNAFEDVQAALPAETAAVWQAHRDVRLASLEAVTASVGEGRRLRDTVRKRRFTVNGGSGTSLVADGAGVVLDVDPAFLAVTLVAPNREHLRKLAAEWKKKTRPGPAETAAYLDTSVYNLSSLVMVVATRGTGRRRKRMLLTGDARADHTLEALRAAGLLDAAGRAHFDLLKIAHHGSDRDHAEDFFQAITARHYVVSADGRYDNPSQPVLEWIGRHAPRSFTVWLTNRAGTGFGAIETNVAQAVRAVPRLGRHLAFRSPDRLSLCVDLLDRMD